MQNFNPKPISDALLYARRACKAIDGFPAELPQTLDQAYAVQLCAIKDCEADLVGFKVGGVPPQFQKQFPSKFTNRYFRDSEQQSSVEGHHVRRYRWRQVQ